MNKKTISIGNNKLLEILKELFPYFTIEPEYHIGERLKLDAFIKELGIGFEYDGIQHFKAVSVFHENEDAFKRGKLRDRNKEDLCDTQNILLIRIKYNEPLTKEHILDKITSAQAQLN